MKKSKDYSFGKSEERKISEGNGELFQLKGLEYVLLDNAPDSVIIHEVDGKIVYANEAAARLRGYSRDELLKMNLFDFLPPGESSKIERYKKIVLKNGYAAFELINRKKDGFLVYIDVKAHLLKLGGKVFIVSYSRDITDRKIMEASLKETEERYRLLVEHSPDGILIEKSGVIEFINRKAVDLLGFDESKELIGKPLPSFLGFLDHKMKVLKTRSQRGDSEVVITTEERIVRPDGSQIDVEITAVPVTYKDEPAIQVVIKDITERKRAEEELRFKSFLLDNATDAIVVNDFKGKIIYVNDATCYYTGYTQEELLNKNLKDLEPSFTKELGSERIRMLLKKGVAVFETVIKRKDGTTIPVEVHSRVIELGREKVIASIARDITERKTAEKAIKRLAYHDSTTGLPNRILFMDRLKKAIAIAKRNKEMLAVLFLDLDNFKTVNDTFGHSRGDKLLKAVSERLKKVSREADTIARLGGDEFTILITQVSKKEDVVKVIRRIIEALEPPFQISGNEFYVTASVGVAIYPDDGEDAETLLKNADIAMYRAKESGKNNYQLFNPTMNEVIVQKLNFEQSLKRALINQEFVLHYQPIISADSGKIVSYEALLRWDHPEKGIVYPEEFVPAAEELDFITKIDEWVLKTACQQNKKWQIKGLPQIPVAVNVSSKTLGHRHFTKVVEETLLDTGLDPSCLTLEITESVALGSVDNILHTLRFLKEKGIQIAIDDFGMWDTLLLAT